MASWYAYIEGSFLLPGSYLRISADPGDASCPSGCFICAIKLDENNDTPSSIPGSVQAAIAKALATQQNQPISANLEVRMKQCHCPC